MKIKFEIKQFKKLSTKELYQLLRLRSEVFVVEQNCVYQDVDDKDEKALHVLGFYQDKLVAYARAFNKHDYFENASIGRVVVAQHYRNKNFGVDLMKASVKAVADNFNTTTIEISAQEYLQQFYESLGFVKTSEMYLEDDIPHIRMKKE